jgi:hypothetical protein
LVYAAIHRVEYLTGETASDCGVIGDRIAQDGEAPLALRRQQGADVG